MPTNVVKTPRDERLWQAAKAAGQKQGKTGDWEYIMGTFENMKNRKGNPKKKG